jgi:hypothetical protein
VLAWPLPSQLTQGQHRSRGRATEKAQSSLYAHAAPTQPPLRITVSAQPQLPQTANQQITVPHHRQP